MQEALELAARGRGRVEPNPMVGCVLVKCGRVVGRGWHQAFGGPHAEVNALADAGPAAEGADAYVTLEPCAHWGKTPPCVDALIRAKVGRVLAAIEDPFPQTAGLGPRKLREAGISIEFGLLADSARELNAPYFKLLATGRSYVIAKWAQTTDCRLACPGRRWISCEQSRALVHQMRNEVDAIIVGIGTVLADDPLLTCRMPVNDEGEHNGSPLRRDDVRPRDDVRRRGEPSCSPLPSVWSQSTVRNPRRIIIDSTGRTPLSSRIVQTARAIATIIAVTEAAPRDRLKSLHDAGCEILILPAGNGRVSLPALFAETGRRRYTNILLEGGAQLLAAAFRHELVDEARVFAAPFSADDSTAPPAPGYPSFRETARRQIGDDLYTIVRR